MSVTINNNQVLASGAVSVVTNGSVTAMYADTSGNVGIGVTPSAWVSTAKAIQINSSGALASSNSGNTNLGTNWYTNTSGTDTYLNTNYATLYQQSASSGIHKWFNAPSGTAGTSISFTQAMTLDASGRLILGATSPVASAFMGVSFVGSSYNGLGLNDTSSVSGTGFLYFQIGGTTIGSVQRVSSTSAVVYNTTSDQRLKSNIADADPVLEKLMNVKVRQYDWTEGDLHQDYGFIAQELEPLLSGVVTRGKTEEDVWQLDYARLTPHLVKAIQEQQAIITQQAADIAALKAKVGI